MTMATSATRKRLLIPIILMFCTCIAQTQSAPADAKLSFDTAAVHENKPGSNDDVSSNVPLGPGNVYSPTGGLLVIRNYPLMQLISFAYRMTSIQQDTFAAMAPAWVRDAHYSVTARTEKTDVTKDELRLMMRSLLADRFGMVVHYESRSTPVYAAHLVKPGEPGPFLRPHPADGCSRAIPKDPTDGTPPPSDSVEGGFPAVCGGVLLLPGSNATHLHFGARDISIVLITSVMASWGDLGRPVVDKTGLTGNYDFAMEFTPRRQDPLPGTPAVQPVDGDEPNFLSALKKQLGIKLEADRQPVDVLLLDHIDHLSEN